MGRLINTEEFIKRIDHYPPDIRDTAKKELRYCKTVDAVPVVHGKWVESNPNNSDSCRLIKCSKCGYCYIVGFNVPYDIWIGNRNYCTRCGAKMDLLDDDTKWETIENGVKVTKYNCTKAEIEEVKAIMGEKVTE